MDRLGRLGLLLLAFFWLFMASMAVAAVWLVEPAKAESLAATGHDLASLTVTIGKVSPRGGVLRLGLYDAASYPDDNSTPIAAADVPVKGGEITVTFKNLPPGRYAIESFQDVNANGKMDTSWLGLPEEPYGFSRDARALLSKPGFNSAAFALAPGPNNQTMHMQNSQATASAGF
jgi:uncharacterized protein (DUF2141 family)